MHICFNQKAVIHLKKRKDTRTMLLDVSKQAKLKYVWMFGLLSREFSLDFMITFQPLGFQQQIHFHNSEERLTVLVRVV